MAAIFMVSTCTDCCTSAHIFHTLPLHGTWTLAAGSQPANILLYTLSYVIVLVMDNNISFVNVLTQNSYVCISWAHWKIQYPLCYNARTELICVHILSTLTLVIDQMFVSSCIPRGPPLWHIIVNIRNLHCFECLYTVQAALPVNTFSHTWLLSFPFQHIPSSPCSAIMSSWAP